MVCERACIIVALSAGHTLDRFANPAMHLRSTRERDLLVDALLNQGVSEAVSPDQAGRLLHDVGGDRLLKAFGDPVDGHPGDLLEHVERELSPTHRGER